MLRLVPKNGREIVCSRPRSSGYWDVQLGHQLAVAGAGGVEFLVALFAGNAVASNVPQWIGQQLAAVLGGAR